MPKARARVHVAWMLVFIAACGDEPAADTDNAAVESRLCARLDQCDLLRVDSGVTDCRDVLDGCAGGLDGGTRADWEHAIEECLAGTECDALEQCYVDTPGC